MGASKPKSQWILPGILGDLDSGFALHRNFESQGEPVPGLSLQLCQERARVPAHERELRDLGTSTFLSVSSRLLLSKPRSTDGAFPDLLFAGWCPLALGGSF